MVEVTTTKSNRINLRGSSFKISVLDDGKDIIRVDVGKLYEHIDFVKIEEQSHSINDLKIFLKEVIEHLGK